MHARSILTITLGLVCLAAPSQAQKRSKPACGFDALPLIAGQSFTYRLSAPETEPTPAQQAALGVQAEQPDPVTIKVVSVDSRGEGATIQLEESFRKITVKTTLECGKGGLIVDPASFFWAGEPGGGLELELKDVKRDGVSFPAAKSFKRGASAKESFRARVDRRPSPESRAKIASGEVEMERELMVGERAKVKTIAGEFDAFRVEIALSGRGRLDGDKQAEREVPAGASAVLWMAPGIGVVQVVNRFSQAWQLAKE